MTFVGLPGWIVVSLLAATAAVLAGLHLLRSRRRSLRVNTTIFWAEALQTSRASSLWRRFRHPLTYLLLLAICAAVILAIGRPVIDTRDGTRRTVLIVLDAGSSMAAKLDESSATDTRLNKAKQEALAVASQLSSKDDLAVVVADPRPRLLHAFDQPRAVLARRIASLEAATLPADRRGALRLADDLAQGRSGAKIFLITDRNYEPDGADKTLAGNTPIEVLAVGSPLANASILSAMFEPAATDPLSGTLRLRVGYWGQQAGQIHAVVKNTNGAVLLDESRTLAAGETTTEFSLAGMPADGQLLSLSISGDDNLEADSLVEFRLPRRRLIRVAIDTQSRPLLGALLEADPAVKTVAPGEAADVTVSRAATASTNSTTSGPTILVAGLPKESTATRPDVDTDYAKVNPAGDSPLVAGLDFESGVCLPGLNAKQLPPQARPLLVAGQSIVAAIEGDAPRQTLWLSETLLDPKATATRRAALPVFVSRAVRKLADWQADPVVVSPRQAFLDPGLTTDQSCIPIVMPADRRSGNLLAANTPANSEGKTTPSQNASLGRFFSGFELFEWLLLVGLCLIICESLLHARGRIF